MTAPTQVQIYALPALLGEATPGPWRKHGNGQQIVSSSRIIATMACGAQGKPDSRLIALSPSLAATVIDQQAEIERLRWWLSEINMRGKQYGPEELADLAVDGLAGKPAEGAQA